MYPRGSNAYGQQSYTTQSGYGQSEADVAGYRSHPSAAAHYGGQYSSVYGSAPLSIAQQIPAMSVQGAGSAALEGHGNYASAQPVLPNYASGDYVLSSHGYGHKGDQLLSEKASDYPFVKRRQHGDIQSSYMGRELPSDPTGRYADSGFAHQQWHELYDRIDQSSLLRLEQLLRAQTLHPASVDGGARQAAGGVTTRHPIQNLVSHGGRMDEDPRNLSMLSGSSYTGQHAPSILGAGPRRNVDDLDLMYAQSSSNPGYGVSLPPGRDYAMGKGLHGTALELDYLGIVLPHGGHSRIDEHKDDRGGYIREVELREEEHRRECLRACKREREREKEREREREKESERERMLERRDRDRDCERKYRSEIKREQTPLRISRDRCGSSLAKDRRTSRQDSPRHEAVHRRHSPVKEKRRDYVCKVYSSSLVEVERGYLAIDKRYPRIFISPELCKVVVNWPKEDLKLSVQTPVSFEHEFVKESLAGQNEPPMKLLSVERIKPEPGHTVWNAKIILMSGLSRNALEELSSEKSSNDRIPHICNILRFALLRKDHSFMAIGGPWDTVDGADPSVDGSSLIQTALRHAKYVTQLDLQNCRHWNPFLEIHYDRVGKDGFFSHKEVTVMFVPDLSECLPSLDTWRDQWLAHKRAIAAEREHQLSLRKENSTEKEVGKGNEFSSPKDIKKADGSDTKKDYASLEKAIDELKGKIAEREGVVYIEVLEKKDGDNMKEEGKIVEEEQGEAAGAQTVGNAKSGKKNILGKIVQKVSAKKVGVKNASDIETDKDGKAVGEKIVKSDSTVRVGESSVKTYIRKKIVKKDPVGKDADKVEKGMEAQVETEMELDGSGEKPKAVTVTSSLAVINESNVKKTIKKKVIKKVPKRKANAVVVNTGPADIKKNVENDVVENAAENVERGDAEDQVRQVSESGQKIITKTKSKTVSAEKQDNFANASKIEIKADKEVKKEERGDDGRRASGTKVETVPDKQKVSLKDNNDCKRAKSKESATLKDEKERKVQDGKGESRGKSNRDTKDSKKLEAPPRHPGLILRTKGSNDSKLRSLSLSLESLLDYTDKDIDESTFELSLFAESMYEMLQYLMGSRLLTFLQKLRTKFLIKRSQRKRQREELTGREDGKISSIKRPKTDGPLAEIESVKSEIPDRSHLDVEESKEKGTSVDGIEKKKLEESIDGVERGSLNGEVDDEEDLEEDPDEDRKDLEGNPEEDEKMEDAPQRDSCYKGNEEGNTKTDGPPDKVVEGEKNGLEEDSAELRTSKIAAEARPQSHKAMESEKKSAPSVDKEALQAFRFFDRNRVGYIRVEDLRLIIHNLGKLLSHRNVKELVQSALLESNTGRDDRILYDKLVRMRLNDI